jgi:hypothetical protein
VEDVFALIADPARHHDIDASDTVGETETPGRLVGAGQVFTMRMTYRWDDGRVDHYRTDNRVTLFVPDRMLEWSVAPHGGDPLGWRWRYDVLDAHDGATRVLLTYDWSGAPEENIARYGVPLFDADQLGASLDRLAAAVASGA